MENISKGNILIAKPMLYDDDFNRSVIMIIDNSKEGYVGLIQNKQLSVKVSELLPDLSCDSYIYDGGPVEQENIYYIHSRPDIISQSIEIFEGLYWSGNFEDVKKAFRENLLKENEIRFFLGYSGWTKKQLAKEFLDYSWFLIEDKIKVLEIKEEQNNSIWQKNWIIY